MAKKPTTKKTEIKIEEATDIAVAEDNIESQRSAPAEKIIKQEKVKNRYRFFSTVSRLNISNVIFDNIRVVVYETIATSKDDAIFEFKTRIQDRFNGSVEDYNKFITAVFGSNDNVIVETISVNNVTEEKITL